MKLFIFFLLVFVIQVTKSQDDPSDSEFVDYGQEQFYEYENNDAKNKQDIQNFDEPQEEPQNDQWAEFQQQRQQQEEQGANDYENVDDSEFLPQGDNENIQSNDNQAQQFEAAQSPSNDDFQPIQNDEEMENNQEDNSNNKVSRSIIDGELDSDNDEYDMMDYLRDEELLMEEANDPVKADTADDMVPFDFSEPEKLMKESEESRQQLAEFTEEADEQMDNQSAADQLNLLMDEQERKFQELEKEEPIEEIHKMEVQESPIKRKGYTPSDQPKPNQRPTLPAAEPKPSVSSEEEMSLLNYMFKSPEKNEKPKTKQNIGSLFGNFDTKFDKSGLMSADNIYHRQEVIPFSPKPKPQPETTETPKSDIKKHNYLENVLFRFEQRPTPPPVTPTPKATPKSSIFLSMIGESAKNIISKFDNVFNGQEKPEIDTPKMTKNKFNEMKSVPNNKELKKEKEEHPIAHHRIRLPAPRRFRPFQTRKLLRKMYRKKGNGLGKSVRVFEGRQHNMNQRRPKYLGRKFQERRKKNSKKFRLARRRRIRQEKSRQQLKHLMRRLENTNRRTGKKKFSSLFKRLDGMFDSHKRFLIRRHARNANQ